MIKKPTLVLDENRCRANIRRMAEKAASKNLVLRPHFKTHQSLEISRWFREYGVDRITVSSLTMAQYFASEWDDITVAFPVNILEIDEINSLASRIKLNLLVESVETAEFLVEKLKHRVCVFIKIDVGYHRTGVNPAETAVIDSIIDILETSDKLDFKGFLSHAGHTYSCRGVDEVLEVHNKSIRIMDSLKTRYISRFPDILISLGDTPGCSLADGFGETDEIRPGNYVFFDLTQVRIGSAGIEDVAVAAACPVVAVHEERNEIIIYGGGVHLSKESVADDEYGIIYGKAVHPEKSGWGSLIPGVYVKKLSQEHGVVHAPDELISKYNPGDLIYILPVHSCMTANLLKSYRSRGKVISRL